MTTAGVAQAGVILSKKLLLVFHCLADKAAIFGVVKNKAISLSSNNFLTDPHVTSRD